MSASNVPATVADLDLGVVIEVLARCGCNVSDAAADLACAGLGFAAADVEQAAASGPGV